MHDAFWDASGYPRFIYLAHQDAQAGRGGDPAEYRGNFYFGETQQMAVAEISFGR